MTMQVGMVANDAIILATDTLANREPRTDLQIRCIRQTFGTSKVRVSSDNKIAVTCARDLIQAYTLADALIAGLTPEHWASPEGRMREIAWSEINSQHWRGAECLVALVDPYPALFLLQCAKTAQNTEESVCHPIVTYAFAGDSSNCSSYWAMRYFDSLSSESMTVETLLPLAAQVVVDAKTFNSGTVSGLEIVICDRSGVRRFTQQENTGQYEAALSRSREIEAVMFRRNNNAT
jgi:hypothetical protein